MMQSEEIVALGQLAGDAVSGFAVRIGEVHEGIAMRVFDSLGATAAPVRVVHNAVARRVYGLVSRALGGVTAGGARALGTGLPPGADSIQRRPLGRITVGMLNGAFGDRLEATRNPLAARMSVRVRGEAVEISPAALKTAFPYATPKLAVFLHGLCQNEEAWMLRSRRHEPYGFRLEAEAGYTPIYIRYNSGRHVHENGRDLAALLDELTSMWPHEVVEIAIFGHSTGGLVARSAAHQGAGRDWVPKLRHLFMLGTPHLGAPLERAANVASSALARLPETRAIARALNLRSAGVKDLRYGYLLEDDWFGHDPDAFLRSSGRQIPYLRTANHYFVSATISPTTDAPMGRLLGDLFVLHASAWGHAGRGKQLTFPLDNYRHFGSANHFDLLNHPAVYQQIRSWLSGGRALGPGDPALQDASRPARAPAGRGEPQRP
jgi:triacylglycerol esterase/lipase EstA (alpha/beta hydrolase family)